MVRNGFGNIWRVVDRGDHRVATDAWERCDTVGRVAGVSGVEESAGALGVLGASGPADVLRVGFFFGRGGKDVESPADRSFWRGGEVGGGTADSGFGRVVGVARALTGMVFNMDDWTGGDRYFGSWVTSGVWGSVTGSVRAMWRAKVRETVER